MFFFCVILAKFYDVIILLFSSQFNDKGQHSRVNSQACLVCDVVASIYDRKSACVERSVCEVMSRNGVEADKRLFIA